MLPRLVTPNLTPSDTDMILRELNRMTGVPMQDSAELTEAEISRHRKMIPFMASVLVSLLTVFVLYPIVYCFCNSKKAKTALLGPADLDRSEDSLPIIV